MSCPRPWELLENRLLFARIKDIQNARDSAPVSLRTRALVMKGSRFESGRRLLDWDVRNFREAEWRHAEGRGAVCVVLDDFEGEREAVQYGVNPFVLLPGERMAMYHWEADQEDFLVLGGEALLIVEGQERPLRRWDFVHCPAGTKHVIVGAGRVPCVVIAVGARQSDELGFPADDVAKRYGASVDEETMDGGVAYSKVPPRKPTAYREGRLPG